MKVGDLVRMKTHDTGLIGIVLDRDYHRSSIQIGILWFGGSGKMDWEPEQWLEVVSESR
jgi:hypothetical protein